MKRPEKVIMWIYVDREKTEFVNHLGKPLYNHIIRLPSWIGLAYKPYYVKIEIQEKPSCFKDRRNETNHDEIEAYVKSNWSKKLTKMRKLNHNYMQVFTLARCDPETRKLSLEEYNQYHQELRELNEKYGVGASTKLDKLDSHPSQIYITSWLI